MGRHHYRQRPSGRAANAGALHCLEPGSAVPTPAHGPSPRRQVPAGGWARLAPFVASAGPCTRVNGLVQHLHVVYNRAAKVCLYRLLQVVDVGQNGPDAGTRQALAGTPAHAPRQQYLAVGDGLHHP